MSVAMSGSLGEKFAVTLTHGPSGKMILTTPPVDNGGDGSSFSPTDLCAASLGACTVTIMALYAAKNQIPLTSVDFEVVKHMQTSPRKISELELRVKVKSTCTGEQYDKMVEAGKACPVRLSLDPSVKVKETFTRL